jgi:hypothetical protein
MVRGHSAESLLTAGALLLGQLYERHPTDEEAHRSLLQPLREDVRRRAEGLLGQGWMFLAPQAILGIMKLALLMDHEPRLDPEMAFSHVVLLSLDLADDLGGGPHTGESYWPGTSFPQSLAMDTVQNQLFNHASDLGIELARWRRTRELAVEYDPVAAARFDAVFEEATGCSPEALFEVGFHALVKLREERSVRLSREAFAQHTRSESEVDAALALLATDLPTLAADVRQEVDAFGFQWAANSLRRHPLLRCDDGTFLVLNPEFLIERTCGSGFLWEVRHAINTGKAYGVSSRTARSRSLGAFGDFTGHVAEEYVADRLRNVAPNHGVFGRHLWREADLRAYWPEEDGKCCDFLIDGGNTWVALDAVDHPITAGAASSGSMQALEKDLERIVVEKAAQLNETIHRMIAGGGSLPDQLDRVPAPKYHPVVVAAAGFPWSPLMGPAVKQRLRERGSLQHPMIHPLTVITTSELEFIESAVDRGRGTLPGMLDHRVASNQTDVPFDVYLHRIALLGRPASMDAPMEAAFRQLALSLGLDPTSMGQPNDGSDADGE